MALPTFVSQIELLAWAVEYVEPCLLNAPVLQTPFVNHDSLNMDKGLSSVPRSSAQPFVTQKPYSSGDPLS